MRHAVLLLLAACNAEPAEFAPESVPTDDFFRAPRDGGCGDATVYAADNADRRAVFFQLNGIAQAANQAGRTLRLTIPIPDPRVSITYQTGRRLTSATCVGAQPQPGPAVADTFNAVGGTLEVVARPTGAAIGMPTADLDLRFINPSFASPAGMGFGMMTQLEVVNVSVGLYPP